MEKRNSQLEHEQPMEQTRGFCTCDSGVACCQSKQQYNFWRMSSSSKHIARKGQILQARLRMECSSLNSDLHRKNIVPSPFCRCGVFESRNHFFFTCPLYSLDRLRYLPDNLDDLTSNDLLFGCKNQSDEFNESLFLKVQEFLIRSGRFG